MKGREYEVKWRFKMMAQDTDIKPKKVTCKTVTSKSVTFILCKKKKNKNPELKVKGAKTRKNLAQP